MNPGVSTGGAQAALAARRAEETRKKLFASSAEIDALSTTEGSWMVNAWAGGGSGGNGSGDGSGYSPGHDRALDPQVSSQAASQGANQLSNPALPIVSSSPASSAYGGEAPRTPRTGPVSFWA